MKKIITITCLFIFALVFCQQEASVWYFGENAGLKFQADGSVLALSDGMLNTTEGCSSIADSNGNLLFYTDGRTVWDRNHVVMPNGDYSNGTGLFGDISSTQSAIIVPKPDNNLIYYIFTVDEPHHTNASVYPTTYTSSYPGDDGYYPVTDDGLNNGLNYSIVDLSVTGANGSVGNIISRNNHLITYNTNPAGEEIKYKCSEKITALKNEDTNEYWVLTHFIDKFYSFKVTNTGVVTTPIVTQIGTPINISGYRRNAIGYLKASPDGTKLAIVHTQNATLVGTASYDTGRVVLYDFNITTGQVTNEIVLINSVLAYGVEFSPDSKKIYATYRDINLSYMFLSQFDLLSSNIPSSKIVVFNNFDYLYALQLAPNNKIYCATSYENTIGVINNPNDLGIACNYVNNGVSLATGTRVILGLPPFITSFFNVGILLSNRCAGEASVMSINTSATLLSANWNFGDGSTSTAINPIHTYTLPGTYTITVTATSSSGTASNSREIVIFAQPTINSIVTLKQCDDNLDGFSAFNLEESIPLLVTDATGLIFSFYETASNAQNTIAAITNVTNYTNQIVSSDFIFVRVENGNGCFRIAQLNLSVSTTLLPSTFQKVFTQCDDLASGSNTDGLAIFDFSSVTAEIEALFPPGQLLDISYYKNVTDALAENNAITTISSYSNVGYPITQNIFVRVDSQLNNECLGLGHHITLNVERIPIIQPQVIHHCDDDHDGSYGFATTGLQTTLLNGLTGVSVSYTTAAGVVLPSPLPNPFETATQTITVRVTNTTTKACFYESTLDFVVDDLPEAFVLPVSLTTTCDDEIEPSMQDGIYPFDTSLFQSTILGSQTGMTVNYYDALGNLLSSPLPNPFNSSNQNLLVEVINPLNTDCIASLSIPLIINSIPLIVLTGNELVCSDNPTFTKIITAGLVDETTISDYTYTWFLDGVAIVGATNYYLTVNTEGTYNAVVSNSSNCTATRIIVVTASNIATINTIEVTDLSTSNSILIAVSGSGDYSYSIDGITYQDLNSFTNILPGIYTVYVKDNNECGIASQEISVLGVPKYFTPNGDGYSDYWNIKGVNERFNSDSVIYIYDQFGKLLKQISPLGLGWDGTYNGTIMPSQDYWYSIALKDGSIIKGHFSLKR
ncbi:T9SS type B sorting domain-containing protein [Flavobacterium sp.]|uniref:T9SS type B sorting domain-containing protein n=1 Tax=Flavobacterium sp. TaxID=239 RepID=UPI003750D0BA